MPVHPDSLLHELRSGEREAFVRYYELYRVPVFNLVSWLLRGGGEVVSATTEVFTTAYRRILLEDDDAGLATVTYASALAVCRERLAEREADQETAPDAEAGTDAQSDLGRRVWQSLEVLPFEYQAVLCLHDFAGLSADDIATVMAVTAEAGAALLFRAREAFRHAFAELSSQVRGTTCRLAEQTAAGAVGRSLADGELRRLREHTAYCRDCRRTLKGWGGGAISLALFLEATPPQELETTPVFGTSSPIPVGVAASSGALCLMFTRIGRAVTSRAAAYVLAAACLALSVGLAAQLSYEDQAFVVPSAAVPGTAGPAPSSATVVRPPASLSGRIVATRQHSLDAVESHVSTSDATPVILADAGTSEFTSSSGGASGVSSVGGQETIEDPSAANAMRAVAAATEVDPQPAARATKAEHMAAKHAAKAAKKAAKKHAGKHGDKTAKHAAKDGKANGKASNERDGKSQAKQKSDKSEKSKKSTKSTASEKTKETKKTKKSKKTD